MEGKEKESKHKHRLKGLFSKEKQVHSTEDDVDDFLYGSDKLNFPAPEPTPSHQPQLSRIDTKSASRWPTTAEIQNAQLARGRSTNSKGHRKGLVVRFTDERPEIIGEGGDEAELPTAEILVGLRNRAHSYPPSKAQNPPNPRDIRPVFAPKEEVDVVSKMGYFRPGPLRRTQTGFESIHENSKNVMEDRMNRQMPPDSHDPKSSAARVKAEMQAGEGEALVQGALASVEQENTRIGLSKPVAVNTSPKLEEAQRNTNNIHIPPPELPPQLVPGRPSTSKTTQHPSFNTGTRVAFESSSLTGNTNFDNPVALSRTSTSNKIAESPERLSRSSTITSLQAAATALGNDAFEEFSSRVAHLFTLFELSAESIRPLSKCSLEELMRAALWWFLHGRSNLEAMIRDRPSSSDGHQDSFSVRQQAYADLAKSLWLISKVIPQYQGFPDQNTGDSMLVDFLEIQQGIISSLRKLTISMKRNNFLPPEDVPLPQGLDSSIWVQQEGDRSLPAGQRQDVLMNTSFFMPLGDSHQWFQYGRMFVRGVLKETGDLQRYSSIVLVTLVRNRKDRDLSMVVTNQHGSLKIWIQADKARGASWGDVEWHVKNNTIDVRLPRGFSLQLQCAQQDLRSFLAMYDYHKKLHVDFKQHQDERLLFESTLETFQYFDEAGNSSFPKEPISECQLRIFEKVFKEKVVTGTRSMHRGFRICLLTSPTTKVSRGINQEFQPNLPIQFGFLRGESGLPAFMLKINNAQRKYTMVFTFAEPRKRSLLHTRLTGASLLGREVISVEADLKSFNIGSHYVERPDFQFLKSLDWQNFRVITEDQENLQTRGNVLCENLRVVMDFKIGSLTDRFNIGPGELKMSLNVMSQNELKLLRQQQTDMTISVLESQVPRELPKKLAGLLNTIAQTETTRTYTFPSLKELHLFETALTGFSIIFDGQASSFNISRRRMVVPIYKKWDAVTTRIQLVQRDNVIQLVAFFENFSHGDCMNFILKSTDVFEISAKSGKFSLRIVDAKFALPQAHGEGEAGIDKGFLCLDLPEYPGEHDDITIVFDNELGKFTLRFLRELLLTRCRTRQICESTSSSCHNCFTYAISTKMIEMCESLYSISEGSCMVAYGKWYTCKMGRCGSFRYQNGTAWTRLSLGIL